MSAVAGGNRGIKILGVTLGLMNGVLWLCTPAIRDAVDARAGRLFSPHRPHIINGVQELLVYFDPWLARAVFPAVYTLGLAAIPFLRRPSLNHAGSHSSSVFAATLAVLLLAFEAVWLFLIAVGVCFRGPNWTLFWPGDTWDPHKVSPLNNFNLSEYFWIFWLGQPVAPIPWGLREFPGFLLLGAYLLAGPVIGAVLFRTTHRTTPYWRWVVLVLLIQIAALVPIKMLLQWAFNLRYLIYIPEYSLSL